MGISAGNSQPVNHEKRIDKVVREVERFDSGK
jgi:hypothetical protein